MGDRTGSLRGAAAIAVLVVSTGCTSGGHTSHAPPSQYDAAVYPSPLPGGGGSIPACPDPTDVQVPSKDASDRAVAALRVRGRISHEADRRATDPAWWTIVDADWASGHSPSAGSGPDSVLWRGRLQRMPELGVPRQYEILARYCGSRVASRSVAVIEGPADAGALQGVSVFLQRARRLLLYYQYP